MKHLYRILFLIILAAPCAKAQTKVFKAVAEDMDQDFQAIFQDGKLVGYLVFTQLERASADSFNYRISIMDENLNDIGSVSFREEKLNLKGVSFDREVRGQTIGHLAIGFGGSQCLLQDELRGLVALSQLHVAHRDRGEDDAQRSIVSNHRFQRIDRLRQLPLAHLLIALRDAQQRLARLQGQSLLNLVRGQLQLVLVLVHTGAMVINIRGIGWI